MNNERERKLEYLRNEFEIARAYASYWQAMAMTGVAATRKMQRMVEEGGYRDLTDAEKTKEALDTMERHILHMTKIQKEINKLKMEE